MPLNQRRLYRTIESFASKQFRTEKELLKHVLNEIVKNESIDIKGGRIWEYEPSTESYRLIHQIGQIGKVEPEYRIPAKKYPIFTHIADQRSVIANETDLHLRSIGILKYSATGVGEKIRFKNGFLYQYILSFNSDSFDQDIIPELNVISLAVSSLLRGRRIEQRAKLLERDLDKAREIQQSILPQPAVSFYHYEVYGMSLPDRIVGGDFFDYLYADGERDRLSIVVGDAASKGFRAAAQALYVAGAIRMGISYHTKISSLMSRINSLVNRTFSEEQFVSMFYAELTDNKKGLLLYSNAGHNSPIVYHSQEQEIELLEPTGQILGPFPNEAYRVENTNLKPGDVVVMYTDGISEAKSVGDELYSEGRIADKVRELHRKSAKEICEAIIDDAGRFSRGSDYTDDKTVVVVRRIH